MKETQTIRRELLRMLAPHIQRFNGSVVVYRGEKVYFASQSRGSTFWSASKAAASVYSAGGYGQFTRANFFVGTYVFFPDRSSFRFSEFIDGLAIVARKAGCKLDYATTREWVDQSYGGRTSWPGDFYGHCVDKLKAVGVWPHSIRYTILGDNWDLCASTHHAAELIVHDRVQLFEYRQYDDRDIKCKVDSRRKMNPNVSPSTNSPRVNEWGDDTTSDGWDPVNADERKPDV